MSRMRYGPRFRSGAVSVGAHYSKRLDYVMPIFRSGSTAMGTIKQQNTVSAKKSHAYLSPNKIKVDERFEAEKRLVERLNQAIDVLTFGLEEVIATPRSNYKDKPLIGQQAVIDLVNHMCRMIRRPEPEFNVSRHPGLTHVRLCADCGAELTAAETYSRCFNCGDSYEHMRKKEIMEDRREVRERRLARARELKAEADNMRRMMKRMELIRKFGKGVSGHGGDQGHGGHPGEDVDAVEAGRRE